MEEMVKKIYYHDTDCGGVVYYANYLKYLEEARTEYMVAKGIDLKELSAKGYLFVVKSVGIDYKSPARYADIIKIVTQIGKIKAVSLEFVQEVLREGKLLVSAKTNLVCISTDFRPLPIPQDIVETLVK
jgi:acyl-CoA thioester hydrolase